MSSNCVAQPAKSDQLPASSQVHSSSTNQVTFSSYREHPFSQWSFRNAGAPMHVLMIPRGGKVHVFGESPDAEIAKAILTDTRESPSRSKPSSVIIMLTVLWY
jgi:hypothetical protein